VCLFLLVLTSSKWLKSHTSGRTISQGADQAPLLPVKGNHLPKTLTPNAPIL
jgi:hypothetical protein